MTEPQEHDLWHQRIMEARQALGIGTPIMKAEIVEPPVAEDIWIIGQDGIET